MTKTIFITGASSGIGRATAKRFSEKGWNVAATMRSPENAMELEGLPGVKLYRLDVTDTGSIKSARDAAIADFGTVDVVVNNAGYAVSGYFENMSEEQIHRQYDVNVFGLMRVTKAFLPHFRANGAGTFVNLSSVGGIMATPGLYVYQSTKFAVEGFSEGISYELNELGIRVILIEPGNIATDFQGRSQERVANDIADYERVTERQERGSMAKNEPKFLDPSAIAQLIEEAVEDESGRVRYPSADAAGMVQMRQKQGPEQFMGFMKSLLFG